MNETELERLVVRLTGDGQLDPSFGIGGKLSYVYKRVPGEYELKINGSIERIRFDYSDFTDIRSGEAYNFNANLLQLYVTATF